MCSDDYYKDVDTGLCEECGDDLGISHISFTSPTFILLWVLLGLYVLTKIFKKPLAKCFDKDGDGDVDAQDVKSACPCLRYIHSVVKSRGNSSGALLRHTRPYLGHTTQSRVHA